VNRTALALLAGFAFAALGGEAMASPCRADHARYTMKEDPAIVAGFYRMEKGRGLSDLAFYVRSNRSDDTFWYFFDGGSAHRISLISMNDPTKPGWRAPDPDSRTGRPHGDTMFMQADRNLRFSPEWPHQGGTPPRYILLPDMAEIFSRDGGPVSGARGFLRLKTCR
jgi:hypothetical protein